MYEWVPTISHHFPGITPLNVYDLSLDWWLVYVAQAEAIVKASERQTKASAPRASR